VAQDTINGQFFWQLGRAGFSCGQQDPSSAIAIAIFDAVIG
jgi:hypothetical protein